MQFRSGANNVEKFKLDNFTKDNEGVAFPDFETFSSQECRDIRYKLCLRLSLSPESKGVDLALSIDRLQTCLNDVRTDDASFDLESVLRSIGVTVCNDVFVNWRHFEEIDKMNVQDLSKHFSEIWYPCSDDIDIFDSSLSWVLSINHEGEVRFLIA